MTKKPINGEKTYPEPFDMYEWEKEEIQRSLYWFITHVNPFSGFVPLPFEVVFDKQGNGYFKDEPPDCFRNTIIAFLNEEAVEIGYELEEFPISNTHFFPKSF